MHITDLSYDVMSSIAYALDDQSVLLLSLTCKKLFQDGFESAKAKFFKDATAAKIEGLIRVFEEPIAHLEYFCHGCSKFQPTQLTLAVPVHQCDSLAFDHGMAKSTALAPTNSFRLTPSMARLVVNSRVFGKDCGPPPMELDGVYTYATSEISPARGYSSMPYGPSVWQQTWGARVSRGELILRCVHVLDQSLQKTSNDPIAFAKQLDANIYWLCPHSATFARGYGRDRCMGRPSIFELLEESRLPDEPDFEPQRLGTGCNFCMSTFDVKVDRASSAPGEFHWVITIEALCQLGECRSMADWKWLSATSSDLGRDLDRWKIAQDYRINFPRPVASRIQSIKGKWRTGLRVAGRERNRGESWWA